MAMIKLQMQWRATAFLVIALFTGGAFAQTVPLKQKSMVLSLPPPTAIPGRSDPASTSKPTSSGSFSKTPDSPPPPNPAARIKSLSAVPPNSEPPQFIPDPPIMGSPSLPPAGGSTMNISPESSNNLLAPAEEFEPGQIAVLWKDSEQAKQGLDLLEREYRLQPVSQINLPNLGSILAVFQLGNNPQAAALRNRLRKDFPGWAVDYNMRYRALGEPRLYANQHVALPQRVVGANVKAIRVGMLDGTVVKIPALNSVKLIGRSFLTGNDAPAAQTHATAIAALLSGKDEAKNFSGIAPGITLFSGSIMRKQGNGEGTTTTHLLQGLDWLIQEKVQIINLSLGGPGDALMAHAFSVIIKKPVVIIAAAGNSGPGSSPSYPAAYPGVLAVTASDASNQIYQRANHGSYITLAAPGVDLWIPNGQDGNYVSGTSYAAAVVTGGVALMLAQTPVVSTHLIQRTLCKTAKDLGTPGRDALFGCGLLQINTALIDWKNSHSKK